MDDDTHKLALYDNTITPGFGTDESYSTSGEISGTGYTAGGAAIASATFTVVTSGGVYAVWDGNNVQWEASTLTGVRGAIAHADAETPKRLILGIDFGQAYQTNDGVLLVSFNASGIGRINVVSP
ncbi:hypothetical protein E1286_05240 [Nonomuraea terrae]|uniref:Uncharacterized protein n=1 Tax=Nonomuraea terrae TaxID=2530383 RepID=A0A4R4Z8T4_9ACTN|nr:hypothetical protein [Nonomuraea terrae]TDD54595.1 hypothetical protein E1286_05240 [Nonomuraea terrae]